MSQTLFSALSEVVFAYQDYIKDEGKTSPYFDLILFNTRCEQIGEIGQIVPFDGCLHKSQDSLFPGDDCVIIIPGWKHNGLILNMAIVESF